MLAAERSPAILVATSTSGHDRSCRPQIVARHSCGLQQAKTKHSKARNDFCTVSNDIISMPHTNAVMQANAQQSSSLCSSEVGPSPAASCSQTSVHRACGRLNAARISEVVILSIFIQLCRSIGSQRSRVQETCRFSAGPLRASDIDDARSAVMNPKLKD